MSLGTQRDHSSQWLDISNQILFYWEYPISWLHGYITWLKWTPINIPWLKWNPIKGAVVRATLCWRATAARRLNKVTLSTLPHVKIWIRAPFPDYRASSRDNATSGLFRALLRLEFVLDALHSKTTVNIHTLWGENVPPKRGRVETTHPCVVNGFLGGRLIAKEHILQLSGSRGWSIERCIASLVWNHVPQGGV